MAAITIDPSSFRCSKCTKIMNYCWTTNNKGKGNRWINGWYECPNCWGTVNNKQRI